MEALVHLGSGIGNLVFATPLLRALAQMEFAVDLLLDADYPEAASLFEGWSAVRRIVARVPAHSDIAIPALPPFYWPRLAKRYAGRILRRPSPELFYANEQEFYLHFTRQLGYRPDGWPAMQLPIAACDGAGVSAETVVLAPGSKTGVMTAKRWPFFVELAVRLPDVAVVGTAEDAWDHGGRTWRWPAHVRMMQGALTLRQTAEVMASAGAVVANDTGLGYIAAAAGTPTLLLFGPTPHATLGPLPKHVTVLRGGLPCEPCWFTKRLEACAGERPCLRAITVEHVIHALGRLTQNAHPEGWA